MGTVVQTSYAPQQRAGIVGMLVNQVPHTVRSMTVETAAGIGFGLAVSQGSRDGGCILAGSAFVGLSVRDVTLGLAPVDPLSDTPNTLDTYGVYTEAAIMTRGDMWVAPQGAVAAGNSVYYNTTTGKLSASGSGNGASGSIVFTSLNGEAYTFKASGATVDQVNIGPTLGDTISNLVAVLNASSNTETAKATYAASPSSPGGAGQGSGADTLLISFDTVGTAGNSWTIATTVTGATRSAATLLGGTAAATQITGARWATSAITGQLAVVSLGNQ